MQKFISMISILLTLYLGVHNGYLALWDTESKEVKTVYPYRIELYPNLDKNALENGVIVESERELTKLLEDYLS